jgi:hypothetical protein
MACAVLLSAVGAYGQNVNGSIVGTVSDSTSAAIPGATVNITHVSHTAQTDASGYSPDLSFAANGCTQATRLSAQPQHRVWERILWLSDGNEWW